MKKNNLKISNTIIVIGFILLAVSIALIVFSMKDYQAKEAEYQEAYAQYEADYDEWYHKWWDLHEATVHDQPKIPVMSDYIKPLNHLFIVLSCIAGALSIGVILYGARPYLFKFMLKQDKETLDYTGEDITKVGKKYVEVSTPIIKKGIDDIVEPAIRQIKNINTKDDDFTHNQTLYCKHCGTKIDTNTTYCHKCGKKQ